MADDDKKLREWISDNLYSLLGYSQSHLVSFMLGIAKKASSPSQIVSHLLDYGLPSSPDTQRFADELFRKIPRKSSSAPNVYKQAERDAAELVRKQKQYQILDADDEDEEEEEKDNGQVEKDGRFHGKIASMETQNVKKSQKRIRKRARDVDMDEDGGDDEQFPLSSRGKKAQKSSDEGSSDEEAERERQRVEDQREREELEKRLREKDEASTRELWNLR